MFNFKKQLRQGKRGEEAFMHYYADALDMTKLDGRAADFITKASKETIELKSDYYDMDSTPNMFMERYSDLKKKSPGGPWQALSKGIKFFVYYYINNNTFYWFYTKKLVKFLEGIKKPKLMRVPNSTYISLGWLVPRKDLEKTIYFTHTWKDDKHETKFN